MSLADVKEVLRVGKIAAPKTWLHACVQLEHWTVLMATFLGAGHDDVAWLLSLTRLTRAKALTFDRQTTTDPQLPLMVLTRVHLTFHSLFESVQGPGPAIRPDLASIMRELREHRLACPTLPPAMQALLPRARAGGPPGSPLATPSGTQPRGSGPDANPRPIPRLQIPAGRNLGRCIRACETAGGMLPFTDDNRGRFCMAYHYVGRCNLNCNGRNTHRPLSRSEEQRLHAWRLQWIDPPTAQPAPTAPLPPPRAPAATPSATSATQPRPVTPLRPATPTRTPRPRTPP
jgi:hypothetical protein